MQRLRNWFGFRPRQANARSARPTRRRSRFESLERREVFSATPLPVLMVIADQQDFYYKEYGDTRTSLESLGLDVVVAAKTTNPSTPHAGSGESADGGIVTPDIALANVDASDYSAIVFVGGWGASSYQYAFSGTYANSAYNGDVTTKAVVNDLIGDFIADDKYVAAICHATTVLAWARVDGVSPLEGKQVSVPYIGAPAVTYNGIEYANFGLMQYEQVVANGAIANTVSGQYGLPGTVADDVVVDGRIITAENYDSAAIFGQVIGQQLLAQTEPPADTNHAPIIADATFSINENSVAGSIVGSVNVSDADAGQTHSFAIVGGNDLGAFAINAATGQIVVANAAALDFETNPIFHLTVQATDSGSPAQSASAVIDISLFDLVEAPAAGFALVDGNLRVQGTAASDTIYVWTNHVGQAFAWLNGVQSGPHALGNGGRVIVYGGEGNDQIFATDAALPVHIYGEGGHDQITGGSAADLLDGGAGVDRIWAGAGRDLILGGAGNDFLDGHDGDDVISGGDGDDRIYGNNGHDVLIGGLGSDHVDGGAGDDLLIGGRTDFDNHAASLLSLLNDWARPVSVAERAAQLQAGFAETVHDDGSPDTLLGGLGDDWVLAFLQDRTYGVTATDKVTS